MTHVRRALLILLGGSGGTPGTSTPVDSWWWFGHTQDGWDVGKASR